MNFFSIFNKGNIPLTKLECISNERRMFTLKNPNLIPWAKGYSNPNPSGLRPSRIWIGMGPCPAATLGSILSSLVSILRIAVNTKKSVLYKCCFCSFLSVLGIYLYFFFLIEVDSHSRYLCSELMLAG